MQAINERRSTNQFNITGSVAEAIVEFYAVVADKFPGWRVVSVAQNSEDIEEHYIAARLVSKQGMIDVTVDVTRKTIVERTWVRDWREAA